MHRRYIFFAINKEKPLFGTVTYFGYAKPIIYKSTPCLITENTV